MGAVVRTLHFSPEQSPPWARSGSTSSRHVSFRAPVDDSDDDGDSDGGAVSRQAPMGSPSAPAVQQHPVEALLWVHTQQLSAHALQAADTKQQQLHLQLSGVEQELELQLTQVQQHLAHKRACAAAADEESRKQRSAERQRRLQEVQRQHDAHRQAQASALLEVKRVQQEAAARQRAAEAAAAAAKAQQQEEARRREQEAAAAAQQAAEQAKAREAAAAQAQQQQALQQQAAQAAPPGAAAGAAPAAVGAPRGAAAGSDAHLKATPGALAYAAQLAAKLAAAEAAAAELMTNPSLKPQRRALEKKITMAVSQISGTQQQVQEKSKQLIEVLTSCTTPATQALAQLTLAGRVVSQCEGQVLKIGSFAFPLAYVCVAVGAAVPAFMQLLLAKLQQACPLLVPQYTMFAADSDREAWYKTLGYKVIDDPRSGEPRRETADEFVGRQSAMVLLFGAIVQTEAPGNPAGAAHGWAWLARCLNSLPPTRPVASALVSFLSHAGYRLARLYGRQFTKVLESISTSFLPALEAKATKDADLRAVGTRLQTYVAGHGYKREPEGRSLKRVDESSYTRA